MSIKAATLYAEITADTTKLNKGLTDGRKQLTDFAGGMKDSALGLIGFASAAAVGGAAVMAMAKQVQLGIKAAADYELLNVRLGTTLKSTGRAAEISGDQIARSAEEIMKLTAFDDDSIVQAYESLMKFGSIGTDAMDRVVRAATDMTNIGGDVAATAESIGRALETGVIPRSWGFSAALKENFSDMVKAGDSGKALTMMLDELNKRYGGQAQAQLNTYTGRMTALNVAWGEYLEVLGTYITTNPSVNAGIVSTTGFLREQTEATWDQITADKYGIEIRATGRIHDQESLNQAVTATKHRVNLNTMLADSYEDIARAQRIQAEESYFASKAQEINIAKIQQHFSMVKDYQGEYESYSQNLETLEEERARLTDERNKLIAAGWSEKSKKVLDLNGKISDNSKAIQENADEHDLATKRIVLGYLEQELAAGGLTEAEIGFLLEKGKEWGIYSQDVIDEMKRAQIQVGLFKDEIAGIERNVLVTIKTKHVIYNEAGEVTSTTVKDLGDEGEYDGRTWTGGSFRGMSWVGDSPSGLTPYSELVYAPQGAYVLNATKSRTVASGGSLPAAAMGGAIPPANGEVTLSNESIRRLAREIGAEVSKRNG